MRFTPTSRLIALAVLLLVATAILWWVIGFPIGRALLDNSATWRANFGYGSLGLMRLFVLALVAPITLAVATSVSPQVRWLALAALALGATLVYGDRSRGDVVAVVLFVFGAAAMAESAGTQQIVTAVAVALVISFAALHELPFATPQKIIGIIVRAVFFYAPLLLGPAYLERWALKRVAR